MNPPFGGRNGIAPWLDRFFDHGNGIALSPDRTSAPWFFDAWRQADLVLFTPKIKFLRPDGSAGKSPSNGTALMAAGDRGVAALQRAARKGLGILALPIGIPHRRAAEIMEAEEAADEAEPVVIHRQSAGQVAEVLADWPVQREGC